VAKFRPDMDLTKGLLNDGLVEAIICNRGFDLDRLVYIIPRLHGRLDSYFGPKRREDPLKYGGIPSTYDQNIVVVIYLVVQVTAVSSRSQQKGFQSVRRTDESLFFGR